MTSTERLNLGINLTLVDSLIMSKSANDQYELPESLKPPDRQIDTGAVASDALGSLGFGGMKSIENQSGRDLGLLETLGGLSGVGGGGLLGGAGGFGVGRAVAKKPWLKALLGVLGGATGATGGATLGGTAASAMIAGGRNDASKQRFHELLGQLLPTSYKEDLPILGNALSEYTPENYDTSKGLYDLFVKGKNKNPLLRMIRDTQNTPQA